MAEDHEPRGLDAAYGEPPLGERKQTGDPSASPAAATDTLSELQAVEARARDAQAGRATDDGDATEERRKRAYALWERDGRPEGRHDEHWHAAGSDEIPEPGTAPWTEGRSAHDETAGAPAMAGSSVAATVILSSKQMAPPAS